MTFPIRSYIAKSGERFPLLFRPGELGMPLFYPSAFVSRTLRDNDTHATQKAALDAIRRLSEWERDRSVSLDERISAGKLMDIADVDNLAQHVRSSRLGKKGEVISASKFNSHWHFICKYIGWLTDLLLPNPDDSDVRKLVQDQAARLKQKILKRGSSKARRRQYILDQKISESARYRLLSIFQDPFQGTNSPTYRGTRLRSVIMTRILYETGMRRGELLSLKIKNFVEASGGQSAYLIIERNHDDAYDLRINQPVAKTLGRSVPISEQLEEQIIEYRVNYRAGLKNVGHSDRDFIFCVHTGRTQGSPLTVGGFNTALENFQGSFPELGESLNAHAFRHDWNYRFSQLADSLGMSEEDEAASREESMGWAADSEMAKVYNLRHRREKAMEIGRKLARGTERPTK